MAAPSPPPEPPGPPSSQPPASTPEPPASTPEPPPSAAEPPASTAGAPAKRKKVKAVGLYRNRVSYLGGFVAVLGVLMMLMALLFELSVKQPSPYIGIFTYLIIPGVIVFGLGLALVGMRLEARRRVRTGTTDVLRYPALDLNDARQRKRFVVLGGGAFFLFVLFTYSAYNGFLLTESVEFCGKTCHTQMGPEMTAYDNSPHARVRCVECHVGSGATYYVHSKVNGASQLLGVIFNSYERPIPTPVKGLRPARQTCEECHWPQKYWGSQLYQRAHFRYDEKSTPDEISMVIKTGGGGEGGAGIHWHMMLDNEITFVAEDDKQQDIPWVRIKRRDGSMTEYFRTEKRIEPQALAALPKHVMDCMDCHNRPAHRFETPDVAVDRAMAASVISQTLPWVKSLAVDTLAKEYPTREAAHQGMKADVMDFYSKKYPDLVTSRAVDIDNLVKELVVIYDRNVFPEMHVSWKTYISNIGHRNSAGCFRCHDGKHVSPEGNVLISECRLCHTTPRRGPQTGMGEAMTTFEKEWHPWQMSKEHLAVAKHSEIQCYECHLAGRRPKSTCNECHSH
jgi:hypothetical protein